MNKQEYAEYLLSSHWKDFSMNVRAERKRCEKCGLSRIDSIAKYKQGLHVHHKTYERIGHELPSDVEVLCFNCHLVEEHGADDISTIKTSLVGRMAMPGVEKIRAVISCANCQKPMNRSVWNFDEIPDSLLCEDCMR